jgi:hypothetical protein
MAAHESTARIVPSQPSTRLHKGGDTILRWSSQQHPVINVEVLSKNRPADPFLGRIHDACIDLFRDRIERVFAEAEAPLTVNEVLDRIGGRDREDVQ